MMGKSTNIRNWATKIMRQLATLGRVLSGGFLFRNLPVCCRALVIDRCHGNDEKWVKNG